MTIPWFFLWSEKYGVFCDIMTSTVSDKYFDLKVVCLYHYCSFYMIMNFNRNNLTLNCKEICYDIICKSKNNDICKSKTFISQNKQKPT